MPDTVRDPGRVVQLHGVEVEVAGRRVLGPVDLTVAAGEPLMVTGPSGSGKSLLCLVLAGAVLPTRGRVTVDGRDGAGAAGPVGLVLQEHGLVDGLTAEENVALPLQCRGLPAPEIARHCAEALASVGLGEEAGRPVEQLSGGERQRVGVARALAGDPALLVADEPTAELDPDNRSGVLALLADRCAGPTIVVVASDDPEVVAMFPRVVSLGDGRITSSSPGPATG